MIDHTPDKWNLIKTESPDHGVTWKILAGWYGGYIGGDAWQLSSGIAKVIEHDTHFELPQVSGSVYNCSKMGRGMTGLMESAFNRNKKKVDDLQLPGVKFELAPEMNLTKLAKLLEEKSNV